MNILGYILVWSLFLGFGLLWESRKENRRLKKQLDRQKDQPSIQRNFRSIIA